MQVYTKSFWPDTERDTFSYCWRKNNKNVIPFVLRLHHETFYSFLTTSEENVFKSSEMYEESTGKRFLILTWKLTNWSLKCTWTKYKVQSTILKRKGLEGCAATVRCSVKTWQMGVEELKRRHQCRKRQFATVSRSMHSLFTQH